jgi:rfaE bifunctional protein nucleotidyltransferase chain/domain
VSGRRPAPFVPDRDELAAQLAAERDAGRTVVLANGCFDLVHAGHVRYLHGAAAEGDVLVVALNTDESVRRNKGPGRPVQPESDRVEVIAAIGCVDFVTVFGEPTADAILRALRPHVHAKGTDWKADEVPEVATVREIGARVAIVGDPKTRSSTDLMERARRSEEAPEASGPA